jgi:hypothetical protein
MLGEVRLGAQWQVGRPCGFKGGAGEIEGRGRAASASPAMFQRIESAVPAPLVDVYRHAWPHRDLADVDVAEKDVPAVGTFGMAAAGEGGAYAD